MAANLNVVKAAAVAVFAVICTVVDITADVSVSFHNLKTSFLFCYYFFTKARVLFKRRSILKNFFINFCDTN